MHTKNLIYVCPYVIKTQQKARNAPEGGRGLFVPCALICIFMAKESWHQRHHDPPSESRTTAVLHSEWVLSENFLRVPGPGVTGGSSLALCLTSSWCWSWHVVALRYIIAEVVNTAQWANLAGHVTWNIFRVSKYFYSLTVILSSKGLKLKCSETPL